MLYAFTESPLIKNDLIIDTLFNIKKDCLRLQRRVEKFSEIWTQANEETDLIFQTELRAEGPYDLAPLKVNPEIIDHLESDFIISPSIIPKNTENDFKKKGYSTYMDQKYFYVTKQDSISEAFKPVAGDFRVSYDYVPNRLFVSILGEQRNGTIAPLKGKFLIVKNGYKKPEDLIALLPESQNNWRIFGRVLGPLGMFSGLYMHFKQ